MLTNRQKRFFKDRAVDNISRIKKSLSYILLTNDKDVIDQELHYIIDSAKWLTGWAEFNLKANDKE